jgi:hypothetical protein
LVVAAHVGLVRDIHLLLVLLLRLSGTLVLVMVLVLLGFRLLLEAINLLLSVGDGVALLSLVVVVFIVPSLISPLLSPLVPVGLFLCR